MTDLPRVTLRPTMMSVMTFMPGAVVLIVVGALAGLMAVDSLQVLWPDALSGRCLCVGHRVTSSSVGFMMAGGAPAEPAAY